MTPLYLIDYFFYFEALVDAIYLFCITMSFVLIIGLLFADLYERGPS